MSDEVYLLDLRTSEWAQLPLANPMRRAGHAMAVLDGKVYCFGGRSTPLPALRSFPKELWCLEYDG